MLRCNYFIMTVCTQSTVLTFQTFLGVSFGSLRRMKGADLCKDTTSFFFARILFSNSNQLNRKFVNDIQPFGIRIEALGVIACNERSFSRMNASVHCMNLAYYCLHFYHSPTCLIFSNKIPVFSSPSIQNF